MIEVRNLTKIYKPKKSTPVTALNNISFDLGETGFIFILGKSGCGKSTLLNVLGGLDGYDSGDIIIDGISSNNFKQSEFAGYRNSSVGFVFQEYNLLSDFSVGANIAIALELQGKEASSDNIEALLSKVDLKGYLDRKPKELSSGEKQRIAIARALIKNPRIILADEPTGALDSNTGNQVLSVLQELSKTKLVVVVTHDSVAAEKYADRIISMSDGKIISDVQKIPNLHEVENKKISPDESKNSINEQVSIILEPNSQNLNTSNQKSQAKYKFQRKNESKKLNVVKSRLKTNRALTIGLSSLVHRKIALSIILLLSAVAFALFGLFFVFNMFDGQKVLKESLLKTNDYELIIQSNQKEKYYDGYRYSHDFITEYDAKNIEEKMGVKGIYLSSFNDYWNYNYGNFSDITKIENIRANRVYSYVIVDENKLENIGYQLVAGAYPLNHDEIAISEYVFRNYQIAGYAYKGEECVVHSFDDLIGKKLYFDNKHTFTVCGIIDTNQNLERFNEIDKKKEREKLLLQEKLSYIAENTALTSFFVSKSFVEQQFGSIDFENRLNIKRELTLPILKTGMIQCVNVFSSHTDESFYETYIRGIVGSSIESLKEDEIIIDKFMALHLYCIKTYNFFDFTKGEYEKSINKNESTVAEIDYVSLSKLSTSDLYNALKTEELSLGKKKFKIVGVIESEEPYLGDDFFKVISKSEYLGLINSLYWTHAYEKRDVFNGQVYIKNAYTVFDINNITEADKEKICFIDGVNFNNMLEDDIILNKRLGAQLYADLSGEVSSFEINEYLLLYKELPTDEMLKALSGRVSIINKSSEKRIEGARIVGIINDDKDEEKFIYLNLEEKLQFYYLPISNILIKNPKTEDGISDLMAFEKSDYGNYGTIIFIAPPFKLSLEGSAEVIEMYSGVLIYVAVGMALFAIILLMFYIFSSINSKKQDIGILRSLGARNNDLFKVFTTESIVFSVLSSILATLFVWGLMVFANKEIQRMGEEIIFFKFGLEVLVIFAVSLVSALISSFIPMLKMASKKPAENIREGM
jgi:ABC-type lipoprotein export system ATPase subunit/ABC-type lipoprotein release transport system permease subunit